MTIHKRTTVYGSYRFCSMEDAAIPTIQMDSVGLELRTSTEYRFDGMNREERNRYLFQYTLSGKGIFEDNGTVHQVTEGHAFLAEIPGNHVYYLPEDSSGWEFIYIMLYGSEAERYWKSIVDTIGHVPQINSNAHIISLLFEIYQKAENKKITDVYQTSGLAYQFLMELCRTSKKDNTMEYPKIIQKARGFILENYTRIYGVEDVAAALGISTHHFIRAFTKAAGITPGKYLSKIRIDRAIQLLHNTDWTVDEIARQVGYSNGNYFCKVFRGAMGTSPAEFRIQRRMLPYSYI